ncbi:FAD-linked oxidase C-terminal domain-containing protein [Cryptobacterium curtum]|uniref:FAD-linked oxidase C-terminal domain-containing protein n=1 Tax=Cryptobacterium curtum TaxID=84163 RepID=UPI003159B556
MVRYLVSTVLVTAKKEYLLEAMGDTAIELMAGIKRVFDPAGILNPGKICN